jgi:antitoxin FitA
MPSLQIRQLPDDVYHALAFRAEQAHRSLAQQTVIELRQSTQSTNGTQRHAILQKISLRIQSAAPVPASLLQRKIEQVQQSIREDRER